MNKRRKRRRRYTAGQKAIVIVFCLVAVASAALTGWGFYKAMEAVAPKTEAETEEAASPAETESEKTPETEVLHAPGEIPFETEETTDVPAETEEETVPAEEPVRRKMREQPEEWNLLLVNVWNKVPEGFDVELTALNNGHFVDSRAYPDLQDMMDDAREAGLYPILCSSYRTTEKQQSLFDNQVNKYLGYGYTQLAAEAEAGKWVAVPGTSEHQTGLAVDIVALDYQLLDENQENTPEQKWLMENSYKYGFVLRYPSEKSDLTGIHYEPWHYRYVGKDAAKEMYDAGICLEEYLAEYMTD